MMNPVKFPFILNKKNGQINGYLRKKDLPKEFLKEIRHSNKRNFLIDIRELI